MIYSEHLPMTSSLRKTSITMEKDQLLPKQNEAPPSGVSNGPDLVALTNSRSRDRKSFVHAFTAVAFLYICFSISKPFLFSPRIWRPEQLTVLANTPVGASDSLVPLEAHIMSKCPDAKVSFCFLPLATNVK